MRAAAALVFLAAFLAACSAIGPVRPVAVCARLDCPLEHLASEAVDASYRNESAYLLALAGRMLPYVADERLGRDAAYWRSFALWQHALARINEDAPREEVDRSLAGAIYRGPERAGSGKEAAIRYARDVIANPDREALAGPLQPAWGIPELHASLAWMLADRSGPNGEAEAWALAALRLRPDWKWARESLLPSVAAITM